MVNSLTRAQCTSTPVRTRLARRVILSAVVLCAALAAAACGGSSAPKTAGPTVKVAVIQAAIKQSIARQHGIETVVTCPASVPKKAGYRFTCQAALDVGSYPVNVLELNSSGGVSYSNKTPLNILNSQRVAKAIKLAVQQKRHLKASVSCPSLILQAKGLQFRCAATTKKGTGTFLVTETDRKGNVSFIGL
jgi:hypothetical protein